MRYNRILLAILAVVVVSAAAALIGVHPTPAVAQTTNLYQSPGVGYVTGGSLTRAPGTNDWSATYDCLTVQPNYAIIYYNGLPGNNYWTYGIQKVKLEWCCSTCQP